MSERAVVFSVLVMMAYMAVGFVIVKVKKGDASHAKTLSAFLVYVCSPSMVIDAFLSMEYSKENFKSIVLFFAISLIVQIIFFLMLYFSLHKKYEDAKYRILTAGAIFGNVGFFGLPLITSLFPGEPLVACYSAVYVMSMNLLVFTVGVFMVTGNPKYMSVKSALINPTTFAILIALPFYFFNIGISDIIGNSVSLLGKMATPVCMFVLGMRLAASDLKKVFTRKFAYIACVLKLVAFPLVVFLCVNFLPFLDDVFKDSLIALSCAPSAAIVLSLAELHRSEQELSANVILLTTLASVFTIPLMILIL